MLFCYSGDSDERNTRLRMIHQAACQGNLFDRHYHLVMYDHNALASNNDIEMVVLALSGNKYQRSQPDQTLNNYF